MFYLNTLYSVSKFDRCLFLLTFVQQNECFNPWLIQIYLRARTLIIKRCDHWRLSFVT
jgi:hypothetical protein